MVDDDKRVNYRVRSCTTGIRKSRTVRDLPRTITVQDRHDNFLSEDNVGGWLWIGTGAPLCTAH